MYLLALRLCNENRLPYQDLRNEKSFFIVRKTEDIKKTEFYLNIFVVVLDLKPIFIHVKLFRPKFWKNS